MFISRMATTPVTAISGPNGSRPFPEEYLIIKFGSLPLVEHDPLPRRNWPLPGSTPTSRYGGNCCARRPIQRRRNWASYSDILRPCILISPLARLGSVESGPTAILTTFHWVRVLDETVGIAARKAEYGKAVSSAASRFLGLPQKAIETVSWCHSPAIMPLNRLENL
jgi:hypothetical protein